MPICSSRMLRNASASTLTVVAQHPRLFPCKQHKPQRRHLRTRTYGNNFNPYPSNEHISNTGHNHGHNLRIHNRNYHASSATLTSKEALSVAIVGTGPSGCYTAKYLISMLQQLKTKGATKGTVDKGVRAGAGVGGAGVSDLKSIHISMIEKLPVPFGLVRSGVAPDHPEVKNVENDFSKLFHDYAMDHDDDDDDDNAMSTATISADVDADADADADDGRDTQIKGNIEFRGNVTVGKDISLPELQSLYDIVVLAYGCESDRKLGLEGEEELKGIFSAREFVAWYNGHPDFVHLGSQFEDVLHENDHGHGHGQQNTLKKEVVVIGQGNVALDCARVLAKGRKGLINTDITNNALDVIGEGVKCTSVVGRRGHVQGAFTIKELRELTKLDDASLIIDEHELDAGLTDASKGELEGPGSRPKIRMDKLLRDTASKPVVKRDKEVKVRFLLNPVKFLPCPNDPSRLGSVLCERTELVGESGKQNAVGTGTMEEIPANMVLVSIGYKGIKIPDLDDSLFDERRGIIINSHGKVIDNLYVCGWLKRGPSGIIGTNLVDAKDTISSIIKDLKDIPHDDEKESHHGLDDLLTKRDVQFVDWSSYLNIDAAEKNESRLRSKDQPREKITNINDMLNCI